MTTNKEKGVMENLADSMPEGAVAEQQSDAEHLIVVSELEEETDSMIEDADLSYLPTKAEMKAADEADEAFIKYNEDSNVELCFQHTTEGKLAYYVRYRPEAVRNVYHTKIELKEVIKEVPVTVEVIKEVIKEVVVNNSVTIEPKITRVCWATKAGNLIAWVDVDLGLVKFFDLRVLQSTKEPGTFFVSPPRYKGHDGKWYANATIQKEMWTKVCDLILAKIKAEYKPIPAVAVPPVVQPTLPGTTDSTAKATVPGAQPPAEEKQYIKDDLDMSMLSKDIESGLFSTDKTVLGQNVKVWKGGTVRAIDINGFRFVTQNPNTGSQAAKHALAGHKIIHIFTNGKWYAKIMDGQFSR